MRQIRDLPLELAWELARHEAWLMGNPEGRRANLCSANLRSADLGYADLRSADLRYADLRYAKLSYADLRYAKLSSADLRSADLDFSSGIPFWCGSFGVKLDIKIAAQLAYHFCRIDFQDCEEAKEAQKLLKDLANKFHRVEECGKIN